MKRIAYICADPGVPVFGCKGASVHVQEVIRAMHRLGATVELFAARIGGDVPNDLRHLRVHQLPTPPKGELAERERALLAANDAMTTALSGAGHFDLIYERYSLWSFAAVEFARARGVRSVLEVNAPLIDEQAAHRGLSDREAAEAVARRAFDAASVIGCVSEGVAQWVRSRVENNSAVIDREAARREFGFKGPTILFVGTPRWHKGMKPLAKAVAEIPGARLAVASRDKEFAEGDWSRYPVDPVPMLPYTDAPRLIAAADVLAIPQLDTEVSHFQMPMKAYDCMAMGVPIVASAISDLPQLLDGCARLVPPGDVAALAGALRETLEQPEASRAMAAKARARCLESYTMAHVGAALREVINKVAPGLK